MKKLVSMIILVTLLIAITSIVMKNRPKKRSIVMPVNEKTALFISGSKQEIKSYLESPKATVRSYDYYLVIINNRLDILEMILKDFGYDPSNLIGNDYSPLLDAVEELKPKAVELLIKYGADVNAKDSYGNSALVLATKIAFGIPSHKPKSRKISKMLIDAGADVNYLGKRYTPIGGALYSNDIENLKYIVDHGGDVKFTSKSGSSYMFSCFSLNCILYFREKGLEINAVNNQGTNVIQNAVTGRIDKAEELTKLIELGADICHKDNEGLNIINYIEKAGMNPHWKTDKPKFYQKKLDESRNTELYKYLEKEYNKTCLENPDILND